MFRVEFVSFKFNVEEEVERMENNNKSNKNKEHGTCTAIILINFSFSSRTRYQCSLIPDSRATKEKESKASFLEVIPAVTLVSMLYSLIRVCQFESSLLFSSHLFLVRIPLSRAVSHDTLVCMLFLLMVYILSCLAEQ